jgi:hypothetical protein
LLFVPPGDWLCPECVNDADEVLDKPRFRDNDKRWCYWVHVTNSDGSGELQTRMFNNLPAVLQTKVLGMWPTASTDETERIDELLSIHELQSDVGLQEHERELIQTDSSTDDVRKRPKLRRRPSYSKIRSKSRQNSQRQSRLANPGKGAEYQRARYDRCVVVCALRFCDAGFARKIAEDPTWDVRRKRDARAAAKKASIKVFTLEFLLSDALCRG